MKGATKRESYDKVKPTTGKTHGVILNALKRGGMTRKEISKKTSLSLQTVCGRVSELLDAGRIEVHGVVWDQDTKRNVESLRLSDAVSPQAKPTLESLGFATYDAYLKSSHWQQRRGKYRRKFEETCFVTGDSSSCHLHHITYDRLGAERDEDLVFVIPAAHQACHLIVKTGLAPLREAHVLAQEICAKGIPVEHLCVVLETALQGKKYD